MSADAYLRSMPRIEKDDELEIVLERFCASETHGHPLPVRISRDPKEPGTLGGQQRIEVVLGPEFDYEEGSGMAERFARALREALSERKEGTEVKVIIRRPSE